MNPSFHITNTTGDATAHLFVFAGSHGFSLAVLDRQQQQFIAVAVYHFNNEMTGAEKTAAVENILQNESLLQQGYAKTDITWCTPQSIITPQSFFSREKCAEMLAMVFGDAGEYSVRHELVLKQHCYNMYRLDTAFEKTVNRQFPGAVQWQQYSLLVNIDEHTKDLFYCNFNPGSITVMLRRSGCLQCVLDVEYNTPEDAVYHLLNICQRFDIAAADTVITVSGMIDESSGLYRELYKYFMGIAFSGLPDIFTYSDELKSYPSHYFSHLFAIAACEL